MRRSARPEAPNTSFLRNSRVAPSDVTTSTSNLVVVIDEINEVVVATTLCLGCSESRQNVFYFIPTAIATSDENFLFLFHDKTIY